MVSLSPQASTRLQPLGDLIAFSDPTPAVRQALDVAATALMLLVLAPLLLLIAVLIWLEDGGAVLFRHERIGRGGEAFHCLKFRSMAVNADELLRALLAQDEAARLEWSTDHKLRRDPRVTRIGRILRATSLDELPQLFNVLRGEMSLVGPRPIVAQEIARYGGRYVHYCRCRPGLTGLWQVSGRNDVSYRRRVAIDAWYARNRCLTLDIQILARTIPAVLARRGSY